MKKVRKGVNGLVLESLGSTGARPKDHPTNETDKRAFLEWAYDNKAPIYLGNTLVENPQDPAWSSTRQEFINKYITWRMKYAAPDPVLVRQASSSDNSTTDIAPGEMDVVVTESRRPVRYDYIFFGVGTASGIGLTWWLKNKFK